MKVDVLNIATPSKGEEILTCDTSHWYTLHLHKTRVIYLKVDVSASAECHASSWDKFEGYALPEMTPILNHNVRYDIFVGYKRFLVQKERDAKVLGFQQKYDDLIAPSKQLEPASYRKSA